jgi:hypothetical protein
VRALTCNGSTPAWGADMVGTLPESLADIYDFYGHPWFLLVSVLSMEDIGLNPWL